MESDWRKRPCLIDVWDEEISSIMAIDENGTTDLEYLRKKGETTLMKEVLGFTNDLENDRWFTTTGVVMRRDYYNRFRDDIISIKENYWENGKFIYKKNLKRVVFHSREIRKKEGPFEPSNINWNDFILDLSSLIDRSEFLVLSSSIDKVKHLTRYSNPYHVYDLCLDFIIERYCRYLNERNEKGILLLESRGRKEDHKVLSFMLSLLKNGNHWNSADHFKNISGIFFNPKWSDNHGGQQSFPLLELSDLVSFPIFKYVRTGKKDLAFETVERKLHNYPSYMGYGLKIFPK